MRTIQTERSSEYWEQLLLNFEELFEWVLLFLTRFYLFYGLQFLTPLRPVALLWWVGGGGGAYFAVCCTYLGTWASAKFLMGNKAKAS